MNGKRRKILCLVVTSLIIFSILPNLSTGQLDISRSETPSTIDKPEWEVGDYWNYTFTVNTSQREHEYGRDWMSFMGNMSFTVKAVTEVEVNGTQITAYEVHHHRKYEVDGRRYNESWGFNITMDLNGTDTGTEYYKKDTLEMVKARYDSDMEGTSTVEELDIDPMNTTMEGRTDITETKIGDRFDYPIEEGENWSSDCIYHRHAKTYKNFTGKYAPENDTSVDDYNVSHDYFDIVENGSVEKDTEVGTFQAKEVLAKDRWAWGNGEEKTGNWRFYFSPDVARPVHINMTNVYSDYIGLNVTYGDFWLHDYEDSYKPLPEYKFSVTVDEKEKSVFRGERVDYRFEIKNEGNNSDLIFCDIEESEKNWSSLSDGNVSLKSGESETVTLTIETPSALEEGTYLDVVNFTSDATGRSESISLMTTLEKREYDFEVTIDKEKEAYKGGNVTYGFTIQNIGDNNDTISAEVIKDPRGWSELNRSEFELDKEEKGKGAMSVSIPPDADLNNYTNELRFTSLGDENKTEVIETTTIISPPKYELDVKADSLERTGYAGSAVRYRLEIKNEGDVEDTAKLNISSDGTGWAVLNTTRVTLAKNQTKTVEVRVEIPTEAEDGTYTDKIAVSSSSDKSVSLEVTLKTKVKGKAPIFRPTWEKGDYWNYSYHFNATGSTIEDMYQEGNLNITVEGLTSIKVDGGSMKVYNVSYERVYRAIGKTERTVGTVDFDMDGHATGTEYYKRDTLELVSAEYSNTMKGPSEVMGIEIMVNITNTVRMEEKLLGDLYSFPIEPPEEWNSTSVIDKYANSYTNFTPDASDNAAYPEDEEKTYDHKINHDYDLETNGRVSYKTGGKSFNTIEILGTDRWSWDNSDETKTGHLTTHFSKEAGNSVHLEMENLYDDDSGLNISDATFNLASHDYDYNPPEDYEFEAYAEDNSSRCKPGKTVGYKYTVKNTGKNNDTIRWRMDDRTNIDSVSGDEKVELEPGESKTFELNLTFSSDAKLNTTCSHLIQFFSTNDTSFTVNVTINTWVTDNFMPSIVSKSPKLDTLTKLSNEKVKFSVEIEDPEDDDITVEWYIDGEYHSSGSSLEKKFGPGEHKVTVKVSDEKNSDTIGKSWSLTVREPAEPNYDKYIFLAVIITAVIVGVVYYYKKRKNKKDDEKEEEEEKKGDDELEK
ncbi:MAG: hypothetical protein KGY66_06550 [Candidatus Thermoplasmatota archaeon]|nr:hypothetical protein [Candidatus Thermoplasmatota archaeon]